MKKSKLGKTDYLVSKIGLGTVQFGIDYGFTKKKSQEEVNNILNCSITHEINFIDTAREYGDSEKKIGKFMSENRNELIIATKIKKISKNEGLDYENLKELIYKSVEASLKDLKLQKIDVLQLHQSDNYLITNTDFWSVVEQLKDEKLIGVFGVSVYEVGVTRYLLENYHSLIDIFQVPFSIFDQRFIALEELLNRHSIGIISRSAFLKGLITCPFNKIPKGLQELKPYRVKLDEIANNLSLGVDELALLYVYYNSLISSTILGVDSPEELEANVNIINKYNKNVLNQKELTELSIEDLNLIDPRKWLDF